MSNGTRDAFFPPVSAAGFFRAVSPGREEAAAVNSIREKKTTKLWNFRRLKGNTKTGIVLLKETAKVLTIPYFMFPFGRFGWAGPDTNCRHIIYFKASYFPYEYKRPGRRRKKSVSCDVGLAERGGGAAGWDITSCSLQPG